MVSLSLAAAGCAVSEEVELAELESESSIYNWTDDVQIPGQSSDRQVGLAYYGGRTYQVHTADNSTELRWSRFNGSSWSTQQTISGQYSDRAPALSVFGNRPVLVYKDARANRFLMSTYYSGTWTSPTTAGTSLGLTTIASSPALAVHEGALLLAYCRDMGSYHRVQVDRYDGRSWTTAASYALAVGDVCKHVAVASLPGSRFDLVFHNFKKVASDKWDDFMYEVTGIGAPSSSWVPQQMAMRTTKPISIVHCNGRSHLVHGGYAYPERIYWTYRDAGGWRQDAAIPGQSSAGGTTLACHGTRPIMVHNGGYPQLWWAEYVE